MQFAYTEEQHMIRASARAVLDSYDSARLRTAFAAPGGYDAKLWQQMSGELGWCGLSLPESCGGAGLGWVELCILQEEQGRRLVASPFFATVVLAAALIEECAPEPARTELLTRIASGGARLSCALGGPDGRPPPEGVAVSVQATAGGFALRGASDFVIHADSADLILVLARGPSVDERSVLIVSPATAGLRIEPHLMLDLTRPMSRLSFDGVQVGAEAFLGAPGTAAAGSVRALHRARIALAAEALGGAERLLEMTTEYVKQRTQFGRAIGSFQALKHRLADMMVAVEAARSASWYAACVADEGTDELAEAAAIAKSYCCDAFTECAAGAIQLHGGVGFTWEHDAHLYFKRARASATLLGSPAWQRERLLRLLGLGAAATPVF
jgi:alkylation response protein AidB-like acyl-CoA dehydrogenase